MARVAVTISFNEAEARAPRMRARAAARVGEQGDRLLEASVTPFNEAEARAPRMPGAPRQIGDDAIAEAVLNPSMRPRRVRLGCGHAPSPIASGGPSLAAASPPFNEAEARAPRMRRRRAGSLCRRKEPDPGLGPFPAPLADAAGQAERRSHDYKRHGTTSLFAALDISLIGKCFPRHRPSMRPRRTCASDAHRHDN